jgi:acetyl-CoA carboxylase carboxyl transferase subunit alpha
MTHPEGYRKALRAMKLAEKFSIPVVTLLDTPGAFPGLSAEERGQGWAIAKNLFEMAKLETQIIVVLIGEGCSGGALGVGIGDVIGMLEHAYYSVISPEGCASILYKDATKNAEAAKSLKMHAEDLIKLNIIDEIIKEPQGGAHLDPEVAYKNVKTFILSSFDRLKNTKGDSLIDKRYEKFRNIGEFIKK